MATLAQTIVGNAAAEVYFACVPHVPFIKIQEKNLIPEFWQAYDQRIEEFRDFDPELVILIGSDHYDGLHLKLMPSVLIGMAAEALNDTGGYPGKINVASDTALACAEYLVNHDFDIATSYAMTVDHGFSNSLYNFVGSLDAIPVLPIHINALCHPRPTMRRCRQLGEAIGTFAHTLGKRVAIIGSGGLSHETKTIFPQFDAAPNDEVRDFIVHGGTRGAITMESWLSNIHEGMLHIKGPIADGSLKTDKINPAWDQAFMRAVVADDLTPLDDWTDESIISQAGCGAGEIRQWVVAAAAARQLGMVSASIDYYEADTPIGVGAGIIHGRSA
ncbi:DODA-type extradiol aromatic ring-opening family dioxygenase [Sphingobium lactosutens]|uniref:Extradiol ring-cleavage dioxygenase class III enzyme subunit B domain-containing protein n=1 Tax=Sphingobium lactosutens DS20 TaxID=1331060 RepID=T0INN1_9SPHN|nr:hypothetical protein [Sphingobium lactosutens]EQB13400.1 hypothetical protein RLDS_16840 [Sphingobium lactosutens DS20]